MSTVVPVLLANLGITASTSAQVRPLPTPPAVTRTQRDVASNQTLVVAAYTEIDRGACRPFAAPNIRIRQQPTLGRLSIQERNTPIAIKGCGTLIVPQVEIVYQALSRDGEDDVSWRVHYQNMSRDHDSALTVHVRAP